MSEHPTKREIQAAFGQRVYEYRDDEGVVYYSFTRAPNIISPPTTYGLTEAPSFHASSPMQSGPIRDPTPRSDSLMATLRAGESGSALQ